MCVCACVCRGGGSLKITFCCLVNEKKRTFLSAGVDWEDLYSDSCWNCLSL